MTDPFAAVKEVAICVLIAVAGIAAGWFGRMIVEPYVQKAAAATAQAGAVVQAAASADAAETHIIVVTKRVAVAAQEAHSAIAAAPKPAPSPACDYAPVVSAWRSGLERVRASAADGDRAAAGAAAVPVAGPVEGHDGG